MSRPSDLTARLRKVDKAHLWHPFTQMADWVADDPVVIASGEAEFIVDTEGNRYIDGVSSLWCNLHGHRRAEIDEAIRRQLERIAHSTLLGLASPPSIKLAERLIALVPDGLSRVFYSDSGATAVEIALKMAFQYWRQCSPPRPEKTKFVGLTLGYHGDTVGAVSVGGIDTFHGLYRPLLFDTIHAPAPYCYRCPLGKTREDCGLACATRMEEILSAHGDHVAAVILEPLVQGAGGMIVHPDGYLRRADDACRANDVLLICDEVATGFGRTGRMFACEHEGVRPDFLCLAKGISGGYLPLAATLTTERVYEAFLAGANRTFFHGHTYTGNALACAAGLASLDVFEKEDVLARIGQLAERLAGLLEPLGKMPHVGEVRQKGLMVGVELVADRETRRAYGSDERRARRACVAARKHGVWVRPLGDVVVLMPPYCISDESLERLVAGVREGIAEATEA
ncbi:MAG TPA: adenosylmethionine--8-amino-7-oxononanoate transaminase [Phycisphaerae bacterium]|nr:adenosylmethionine--8-amino-7-oxononanoate transaminase [Phycisphaerae bacterium]